MSWHDKEQDVKDFTVEFLRKTDKAILVRLDSDGRELWCPISVIHDDSEIYDASEPGEIGTLVIHEWFAVKNDW